MKLFLAIRWMQLLVLAFITGTVFLQLDTTLTNAAMAMLGVLFYNLIVMYVLSRAAHICYFDTCILYRMFLGTSEIPATIDRLPVLFRQRDFGFYPSWVYVVTELFVELPLGLVDSGLWAIVTYWLVGMTPSAGQYV